MRNPPRELQGPPALAAALMMKLKWIFDDGRETEHDADDAPPIYLRALAFVRPSLTGMIAEDADRVIAAGSASVLLG